MSGRPLLLIAHPGHELLVYGWLSQAAPRVCILTDGSGRNDAPRTHFTEQLLAGTRATRGPIFGRHSDAAIYRALLDHSPELFVGLACELAETLSHDAPAFVVTDALEGYNPVHDLCRWIAGAALSMSSSAEQYEFSTVGLAPAEDGFRVELDRAMIDRKLAAANEYVPLRAEVDEKLQRHGRDFVGIETFARVRDWSCDPFAGRIPDYEHTGEERVANSIYRQTIRYRGHLLPIRDALCAAVEMRV